MAVSFIWFFGEDGFPVEVSSLTRKRPNEFWRPLAGLFFFETGVDLPSRVDEHALSFVERFSYNMYDTVDFQRRNLKCRVLTHRDFRYFPIGRTKSDGAAGLGVPVCDSAGSVVHRAVGAARSSGSLPRAEPGGADKTGADI